MRKRSKKVNLTDSSEVLRECQQLIWCGNHGGQLVPDQGITAIKFIPTLYIIPFQPPDSPRPLLAPSSLQCKIKQMVPLREDPFCNDAVGFGAGGKSSRDQVKRHVWVITFSTFTFRSLPTTIFTIRGHNSISFYPPACRTLQTG